MTEKKMMMGADGMSPRTPGTPREGASTGAERKTNLTAEEVRAKHKEFLFPSVANYYGAESVVLERREGAPRSKDLDGKQYLDFFGGILTLSVGHSEWKP